MNTWHAWDHTRWRWRILPTYLSRPRSAQSGSENDAVEFCALRDVISPIGNLLEASSNSALSSVPGPPPVLLHCLYEAERVANTTKSDIDGFLSPPWIRVSVLEAVEAFLTAV